ncbi:DUF3221 domain-containing protein [Cohnella yongneupensis]|uniref:DUF3221 domain-containing protein n=1 Tax=Cohnella yongneupensis TaxID=425006 RepID=A0ABW0QWJ2_9BACL
MGIALLTGCDNGDEANGGAGMVGFIVKKATNKILVVAADPLRERHYDAVWVRRSDHEELLIGQKVEVFFKEDEIETSNPGQGTARRIRVLEAETSGSSRLKPEEAIRSALNRVAYWEIPVITKAEYISADHRWIVTMFDGTNAAEEVQIIVKE